MSHSSNKGTPMSTKTERAAYQIKVIADVPSPEDVMNGDDGVDEIYGGADDDFISSISDDSKDFVDCGRGIDTIDQSLDTEPSPRDICRNCERSVSSSRSLLKREVNSPRHLSGLPRSPLPGSSVKKGIVPRFAKGLR